MLPGAISADGDDVFVATAAQVPRLPGDGSAAPVALVTVDRTAGPGLVVDATHVYDTVSASPGAVRRVPRAGGTPESIAEGDFPPKVMKAPLAGGAPVMLGAATTEEIGYSSSLVLHGDHVDVRTTILKDGAFGIVRLRMAGGTAEPVAFDPALGCLLVITGSGSGIYFTFPGGVTRLDLP